MAPQDYPIWKHLGNPNRKKRFDKKLPIWIAIGRGVAPRGTQDLVSNLDKNPMTLADYLKRNEISLDEFADLTGVRPLAVRRWIKGERTPRPDKQREIYEKTGGAVTPNDWVKLPNGCGAAA